MTRPSVRRFAVAFLSIQGAGATLWWAALLFWPPSRAPFLPPGAPDGTLLAFAAADLLLFAGGSLLAAAGLAREKPWAWTALCIHGGAAVYAALYCLALPLVTGGGWLTAASMLPSLILVPAILWLLRPACGGAL